MIEEVIRNLTPGRALDMLVAEKVLGWSCQCIPGQILGFGCNVHDAVPFSSKIASAWLAVKAVPVKVPGSFVTLRFPEREEIASCHIQRVKFGGDGVFVQVSPGSLPDPYRNNIDVAMCVAVARAALIWTDPEARKRYE